MHPYPAWGKRLLGLALSGAEAEVGRRERRAREEDREPIDHTATTGQNPFGASSLHFALLALCLYCLSHAHGLIVIVLYIKRSIAKRYMRIR